MNKRWLLLLVASCLLDGGTVARGDDWPQWRGPRRDDVSQEKGLLKEWPKGGPKLLWTYKDAGLGFSGFAIVGDVLYTMGGRGAVGKEEEYAIALDVKDLGQVKELWSTKIGPLFTFKSNRWGDGPRATPTVDGDFIYCLGGQGELVCLNRAKKGEVVWRKNLITDFGGQVMERGGLNWGYCESPLVDGEQLICCPGGPKGWMMALDKSTGKEKWRTKELTELATDASVVVAEIGGVRQYINLAYQDDKGGVAGVDAKTGEVLWYFARDYRGTYGICTTPVVKDDLVYLTSGYNAGCNLVKVTRDAAGKFSAKDLYKAKAQKLMKNDHGGVVLVGRFVYGYSDGLGWVCQELQDGKEVWTDRGNPDALDGKGSLTYADGHLYLLSERGEACLLEATNKAWEVKGRFALPELSSTRKTRTTHQSAGVWTHPVVANGRLYLRDQELIYCYAVR